MSSDYGAIGKEIFNKLDVDPARLGQVLSMWNEGVRRCLEGSAEEWNEVPAHCVSACNLCCEMQGAEELRDVDTSYAEGIFHAYEGISYLYQADKKAEEYEKRAELAKAIKCLEKSRQAFRVEYPDHWNEIILYLNLGRIYRGQNKWNEALIVFQRILSTLDCNRLSIKQRQEIERVVPEEIEETRKLFGPCCPSGTAQQHREKHSDARAIDQKPFPPHKLEKLPPSTQQKEIPFRVLPVMDEIAAGKEKPASDDIIGYMRQTDEFEFEFEGQTLKAELLKGSRLTFLPEYDYVAIRVSGDSMDKAGVFPNDYTILRRSKPDSSGDIVAVVFRNEDDKATLKRFYLDKPSGRVALKPESSNPEHKTRVLRPEVFAGDNPSVAIVGIAIAVLSHRDNTDERRCEGANMSRSIPCQPA